MNSNSAKICAILISLGMGVGALLSHEAGRFFPLLPTTLFIALSGTVGIIIFSKRSDHHYTAWLLAVVASCSVLYRVFLFASPASLSGIDPNLYATWVRAVLSEGTIEAFQNTFYSEAPASVMLPATFGLITDISSTSSLIVYPIVAGILAPVLGAVFFRHLSSVDSSVGVLLTAILSMIAATSVRYSYIPIAQMLSGLLLGCLVATLLAQVQSNGSTQRYTILVTIFLFGLAITHKIGVFFVFGGLVLSLVVGSSYGFAGALRDQLSSGISLVVPVAGGITIAGWAIVVAILAHPLFALIGVGIAVVLLYALVKRRGSLNNHVSTQTIRSYLALSAVILAVQWSIITAFAERFIVHTIGGLLTFSRSTGTIPNYQAAIRASSGIFNINGSWANVLLPVLLLTLVLISMIFQDEYNEKKVIGMGFIGIPLILSPTSIIAASSVGINAARLFLGLNPLMFSFIAIGFTVRDKDVSWKVVLAVVFVILIANQAFAVQSAPDYPGASRQYLEASEVEAMEFAAAHTNQPIHTDRFATLHRIELYHPPSEQWKYASSRFKPITTGYANRSLLNNSRRYILQRGIDVYLFDSVGYWNLTWRPTSTLNQNRSKVYTASDTGLFYNNSS